MGKGCLLVTWQIFLVGAVSQLCLFRYLGVVLVVFFTLSGSSRTSIASRTCAGERLSPSNMAGISSRCCSSGVFVFVTWEFIGLVF